MNKANLLKRITVDSEILAGKPIIRGYRISVEQILKALAAGISEKEILKEYPELEKADIQACLLYAAQLVENEKIFKIAS